MWDFLMENNAPDRNNKWKKIWLQNGDIHWRWITRWFYTWISWWFRPLTWICLIINNDILREVVFEQDDTDISVGIDEENDWSRIEEPPFCATFTGMPGLNNIDMVEDPQPIDFFYLLFRNSM